MIIGRSQLYIVKLENGEPHAFYGDEEAVQRLYAGQDVAVVTGTKRIPAIDIAIRQMETYQ